MSRPYPDVPSQPRLPELEERVLASWEKEGTFRASVEHRPAGKDGANEFVFYDGPPFANGLPHYGHLLTSYVKDIVPRYQTMRGRRVERRFGWDCHGLPAEMEAEKELAIHGRAKIQEYGIERFNAHCRASVMKYTKEWERTVGRAARWVDFESDYKTMDLSYMESVMWAFAELWKNGLVYESYRVMPYSWAAETPVSNFETRIDNSYRERQDPAITVRFELERQEGDPFDKGTDLWAWTTTPWTLPSNLALAVGPEIDYAVFVQNGRGIVLAEAAVAKYERELKGATRTGTRKGRDWLGRRYTPLFPYFKNAKNAFRVLAGDFVDTADGTGIVHMAPGFGEDDQRVCAENGIEIVCPVDEKGRFTSEVPDWQGVNVFEANKPIIGTLKQRGVLVRHDTIVHNYPHCWRTDEPLIYKALSSWFVKVTALRDRMVALNQRIRWIPEHVRDGQFGKWLEGARDWSISRNRFWGSPIPVWRSPSGKLKVFGSIAELERASGQKVTDLHRPFIDRIVVREGGEEYRRVEDVLDCWFESGSMPFAQVHYPFENRAWFDNPRHAPADFIVEYVAQTRGWFYTLMVLSTALFDREPFKNCICHGVVLDENGQKLSKRLKNYRSPEEIFASQGSDALRWYLCSSPIVRGGDLNIDKEGKSINEVVRLVIHPIWNAYHFFCLYANADGARAKLKKDAATSVLDRYVLAKLRATLERVTAAMDAYDLAGACAEIRLFLDALNNWYIRRSRPRFWREKQDTDKQDAYDTLYTVLTTLCRMCAPLLPLVSEEIFRGLTGEESVHLVDWPEAERLPQDKALVRDMDRVREVCSVALGLREEKRLRVRLPLAELAVAAEWAPTLEGYRELIESEVNIKIVRFSKRPEVFAEARYSVNARKAGPRLGGTLKAVLSAVKAPSVDFVISGKEARVKTSEGWVDLAEGEWDASLVPSEGEASMAVAALSDRQSIVALDTRVTVKLEREGLARDLVRVIQQGRKDAKLHVSDRIRLRVQGGEDLAASVREHRDYIATQTLATEIELAPPEKGMFTAEGEVGDSKARIGLAKV